MSSGLGASEMPSEIDLGMPPAGYAVHSARENETVTVQYMEFTSSEDGQYFIKRLEGIPNDILGRISPQVLPSQVDTMFAIIRNDGKATVYINEPRITARVRARRSIKAGELVSKNDIVDVDQLDFGVEIPADLGVVFLFSIGWRKGLFYDFGPISGPDQQPRSYDILATLRRAYSHVLFQERFSISDAEWDAMFAAKWFPFAGLGNELVEKLVNAVRSGWNPDELLGQFTTDVRNRSQMMRESWSGHPSFHPHMEILNHAINRFSDGDFRSCTGLLFPRIEGILRTHHQKIAPATRPSATTLTDSAVSSKIDDDKCLLLPRRFSEYLRNVYFANFDPESPNIDVSRHSVAHGVASTSDFNEKSALLGILVVHQLFYVLEKRPILRPSQSPAPDSRD